MTTIIMLCVCIHLAPSDGAQLVTGEEPYLNEDGLERCVPVKSVQGRLKANSEFWTNTLNASDFVQGIVKSGYRLPFLQYPIPMCMRNHKSALENAEFVQSAIEDLPVSLNVKSVQLCAAHC